MTRRSASPTGTTATRKPQSAEFRGKLLAWVFAASTIGVLLARLLVPTEGAALGDTLWIVQWSLLTFLVWVVATWQSGQLALRLDWVDGAVLLLASGQFLSAAVNQAQADRRAMVNVCWEWCGLVVTWFLVKRLVAESGPRRAIALSILALSGALAGLGIWQHYVAFGVTRSEVARLNAEWEQLQSDGRPADPREARIWDESERRLRAEFVRMGIPSDPSARILWEQRLNFSSEPLGTFALANSFAGLLLPSLLLWLGLANRLFREPTLRWRIVAVAAVCLTVGLCFLLTKSRTAYVGLLAAAAAALVTSRLSGASRRRWLWPCLAAGGVAIVLLVAVLTGGLDRLVMAESLKSLRYRGEYWAATWQMMTDGGWRWLWGVGPGNFREFYLEYKLPASSEEIADPHNLLLDVWAGGGLLSLLGLGVALAGGLQGLLGQRVLSKQTSRADSEAAQQVTSPSPLWPSPALAGGALAFAMAYLLGGAFDDRLVLLACGWIAIVVVAAPLLKFDFPDRLFAASVLGIAIHLLGAGGIAMPAITQTWLVLMALSRVGNPAAGWSFSGWSRPALISAGLAGLALYLGCWFTATIPVLNARSEIANGDAALVDEGRFDKAERAYRNAAKADALSSEACDRLAQLYLQRWLATPDAINDWFDRSVYWQKISLLRRPRHVSGYRALGALYLARFDRTQDPADAELAAAEFNQAAQLYPNHAELQSELAEACFAAGQEGAARAYAARALELDEINRNAGHSDKVLADERHGLMEGYLKAGIEVPADDERQERP